MENKKYYKIKYYNYKKKYLIKKLEYIDNILEEYNNIKNKGYDTKKYFENVEKRIKQNNKIFKFSNLVNQCTITKYRDGINDRINSLEKNNKNTLERENIISIISKLYGIKSYKINQLTSKYYYLLKKKYFSPKWYNKIMFDIKQNDYQELINKLIEFTSKTKTSYFKNLNYESNKSLLKQPMNEIDKDYFATLYTSCRPKSFTMFLWEKSIDQIKNLMNYLDGDVYYVKKFTVTKNQLRNILLYIYTDFSIEEIFNFIDKKIDYIKKDNDEIRQFYLILFDNIKDKKLSGQGSDYKKDIRNFLLNKIKEKGVYGNDLLHVSDYFYQTVEITQALLNKNSMQIFKYQRIDNSSRNKSFLMFNTIRKYLYTEHNLKDISKMLFFSGIIMYVLGFRGINDVDSITINNGDKEFNEKIYKDLINEKTKIVFLDTGIENYKGWKESWKEKNKFFYKKIKIESYDDICFNPRYHFYFMGLKYLKIDLEIVKKSMRLNYGDLADFFMLTIYTDLLNFNENNQLRIPNISDRYDKVKNNIPKLIQLGLKKKYNINISLEEIKKHLILD